MEIYIHAGEADYVSTFDGEDPAQGLAAYGICIGEVHISEISVPLFKKLAIEMVNHLMANGHHFEIGYNWENIKVLKEIS